MRLHRARAWLDIAQYLPFYAGDTIGGLWLAFKALSVTEPGHHSVYQATALAKLIEGELLIDIPRTRERAPWDKDLYEVKDGMARIRHKGELYEEPIRDRNWKRQNLRHENGRYII